MGRHPEEERRWAVARVQAGDPVATVSVEHQRLRVMLGADLVAEFAYRLR